MGQGWVFGANPLRPKTLRVLSATAVNFFSAETQRSLSFTSAFRLPLFHNPQSPIPNPKYLTA